MNDHVRALIAEAAGTFMFVTIGAGSIVTHHATGGLITVPGVALAHGLSLAVAVSIFGSISGGHFNPAVTLGLAVARKHPRARILSYCGAQLVGALAAGLLLRLSFDHVLASADATSLGTPALAAGLSPLTAIVIEMFLTIFLLWAVFGTAVAPNAPRIAGFGIGLTVAADILMGGPLTGAAMNPARWFGPAVAASQYTNWSVWWIGPLLGGVLAGLSYRYVFAPDVEREPIEMPTLQPAPPTLSKRSDRTDKI